MKFVERFIARLMGDPRPTRKWAPERCRQYAKGPKSVSAICASFLEAVQCETCRWNRDRRPVLIRKDSVA